MESLSCSFLSYPVSNRTHVPRFSHGIIVSASRSNNKNHNHKKPQHLPKNLRYRRQTEAPPDSYPALHRVDETETDSDCDENDVHGNFDGNETWESDEIEAISSLFQGRVPQKPGNLYRERPSPLPLPHKIRPLGFPTSKKIIRAQLARSNRQPVTNLLYKNPTFLITLARDIGSLPRHDDNNNDVSVILDPWARFLRKGSLSLTIRELGHMGLPKRALHVFSWVQKQPHLFPDNRVLASTVEVLARSNELKVPFDDLDRFITLASRPVYEAMVKGYVKGGNTRLALRLISAAKKGKRTLDPSVYAKLILEIGKNPDKRTFVLPLLEELANRDDLKLSQQDCTAVMKVCTKLGRSDLVEALYDWFKKCGGGGGPSVVMYTTLIHSRCLEGKFREAMGVVWEMEELNCLLDLPAYRVVIKLFVSLNDLSRTARYFAKLKESGFRPPYDIYRDVIGIYMVSGRLAKCKEIQREAEMVGHKFDELLQG